MKIHRHQKRKNVAFLYEILIRELSKSLLEKNINKKKVLINIIKSYFQQDQSLKEELSLFKQLYSSVCNNKDMALRILQEARLQYSKLDQEELNNKKNQLLSDVKKECGEEILNTFVPNYKTIASIYQIFSNKAPAKTKVMLENEIIEDMVRPKENKETLEPLDNIIIKSFVNKFNEVYQTLSEGQISLLNKYIFSFTDNGTDLKLFLDDELGRIKNKLNESLNTVDPTIKDKLSLVIEELKSFSKAKINTTLLEKVLKAQDIIKEIDND